MFAQVASALTEAAIISSGSLCMNGEISGNHACHRELENRQIVAFLRSNTGNHVFDLVGEPRHPVPCTSKSFLKTGTPESVCISRNYLCYTKFGACYY